MLPRLGGKCVTTPVVTPSVMRVGQLVNEIVNSPLRDVGMSNVMSWDCGCWSIFSIWYVIRLRPSHSGVPNFDTHMIHYDPILEYIRCH